MKPTIAVTNSASTRPANRWALVSLALSMLLSSLGTSLVNVGLPALAQAFDATFQEVQWIVIAYLLAITTLIVSVGSLGDLFGRRRLLLGGIALFTMASALCAMAPTLGLLIGARALQGLGAAIMMALTMAFVADTVVKAKTGSAMGLLGTMSAIGTALGPSLGGLLIGLLGWRAMFLATVPSGLMTLYLAWRYLPASHPQSTTPRAGFDSPGTLLLALTLAAYALAMTLGRGHFGPLNIAWLLIAGLGAGIFVFVETHIASPLIRLTLLRNSQLSGAMAMSMLVTTVMMATLVIGPFYLTHGLGLNAVTIGLVLAIGPCIAALTSVPAGRIVDRFRAWPMTVTGLMAMVLGCLTLSLLPQAVGISGYVAPMMVLTLGYALFQTANNTTVMADVATDQRGVVSGLLNLSRNLGLMTGASVLGAVFAFASGATDITTAPAETVGHGMRVVFAVASGLVGVALAVAYGVTRIASKPAPTV